MNALSDQPWVNYVVLQDSQNTKKQQHQKRIERTRVKYCEQRSQQRDRQWSNERNKFEKPGEHTHHGCAQEGTGWLPQFVILRAGASVVGR